MPANQKPAGIAMFAASSVAMLVSPKQNQVRNSAMSCTFSSFVRPAGSNMPIAWSTPQQNVRVASGRAVSIVILLQECNRSVTGS